MSENLSITDTKQEINLESNKSDAVAIGMKSLLGIVPFGSLISEIATNVIPNQRTDRIALFVEVLNEKFKVLDKEVVELKTKSEEFTDLLQDGFVQASRALTPERLDYIATLLTNSIEDEVIEYLGKKKLLSLLGELNDAEIVWLVNFSIPLRFMSNPTFEEFYEKHKNILKPATKIVSGIDNLDLDRHALQKSYEEKLRQLGLINDRFDVPDKGENPKFDRETGRLKAKNTSCTPLGKLLLKFINQLKSDEEMYSY
jgi:hypothetical protein